MTKQAIVAKVFARPFVPFVLKMADGSTYTVRHPELIAVGKRLATAVTADGETEAILDLSLMTEIVPAPAAPSPKKRTR